MNADKKQPLCQNKNKFMVWCLVWFCTVGLQDIVSLNFLVAGHTSNNLVLEKRFSHTSVSSLEIICQALSSSTWDSKVNIPELLGEKTEQVFMQTHDWHSFQTANFKPLPSVKHHFLFTCTVPEVKSLILKPCPLVFALCISDICVTASGTSKLRR